MNDDVPIVLAFDRAYAPYASVTIASALVHTPRRQTIVCIHDDADQRDIERIRGVCERLNGACEIHKLERNVFEGLASNHVPFSSSFLRLLIPELVAARSALYLDCDVVVTTDLTPLLELDLGAALVAGCHDQYGSQVTKIGLPPGEPYINTGVLRMNLRAMREGAFRARCESAFRDDPARFEWADQCAINLIAAGSKLVLDGRWNVLLGPKYGLAKTHGHLVGSAVFHACDHLKPWMGWADSWLIKLWTGYARLAEFDGPIKAPQHVLEWSNYAAVLDGEERFKESAEVRKRLVAELWQHSTGRKLF